MIAFVFRNMKSVLQNIADDEKCDIHRTVLGVCENQSGWFDIFCPGTGVANSDDGELYAVMVSNRAADDDDEQSLVECFGFVSL